LGFKILDCTSRDGGYVNNWEFGEFEISEIISSLLKANIDIIEIGFVTNQIVYDKKLTKFTSFDIFNSFKVLNEYTGFKVIMINFGEFPLDLVPEKKHSIIDGIRVAFHKKDIEMALLFSKSLILKGYKVFIQPMVTAIYSSEEFIYLLKKVNEIKPYSFYIVDSFGYMDSKILNYLFVEADKILDISITIGFHSHNNMQLSFSNAIFFLSLPTTRDLVIDSSLYGMGRGAGNLNTELLLDLVSKSSNRHFDILPILEVIDFIIMPIFVNKPWGYSLPLYLSAKVNCHPNYASFLEDLGTLTTTDILSILNLLTNEMKVNFSLNIIKQLYTDFLGRNKIESNNFETLQQLFKNKNILLLGPGRSLVDEIDQIKNFIRQNSPIIISVNFDSTEIKADFTFFSNRRRYIKSKFSNSTKLILTSNITNDFNSGVLVDYNSLTNTTTAVEDNSGLMLLKLLSIFEIERVFLAGFDGYDTNPQNIKYTYDSNILGIQSTERRKKINLGMNLVLNEYSSKINISFLTKPRFLYILNKKLNQAIN